MCQINPFKPLKYLQPLNSNEQVSRKSGSSPFVEPCKCLCVLRIIENKEDKMGWAPAKHKGASILECSQVLQGAGLMSHSKCIFDVRWQTGYLLFSYVFKMHLNLPRDNAHPSISRDAFLNKIYGGFNWLVNTGISDFSSHTLLGT